MNCADVVFVFLLKRKFIGFGTIFNMVFVGYTADFMMGLLEKWQIAFDTLPARMVLLAAAVLLLCIGVAVGFLTGMQTEIQWKIIGIGTVILDFCTGPLIQFFRGHWSDKMLKRYCGKGEVAE